MSENFIDKPLTSHERVLKLCQIQLSISESNRVDAELLTAVIVRASGGKAFFSKLDAGYELRLREIYEYGNIPKRDFLKAITVFEGCHRGSIPKYQFQLEWLGLARGAAQAAGLGELYSVVFACNFGLVQLPGWRIIEDVATHQQKDFFAKYVGTPVLQITHLINRLHLLICMHKGCLRSAMTEFYGDQYGWNADQLAIRTLELARHYRETGSVAGFRFPA
jgi:hypothetical protein